MHSSDGPSGDTGSDTPPDAEVSEQSSRPAAFVMREPGSVSEGVRAAVPPGHHGVFEVDGAGNCLFASEGIAEILGVPVAEIIGRSVFPSLVGIDPETIRSVFGAGGEDGEARLPFEDVRIRTKGGGFRWVRATARVYRDAEGAKRVMGSLYDVTGQHEIERILEHQLEYDRRIGRLSLRLVESDFDALDDVIREGLAEIADLAGADRAFLFEVGNASAGGVTVFEWTRGGVESSVPEIDAGAMRDYAWYVPRMLEGEIIRVARVADLPDEASGEAERMRLRGVHSVLGVPVRSQAGLIGYLSFECLRAERDWSDWEMEPLRLAATVFIGAILRREAEQALSRQMVAERRIADLARRFVQLGASELEVGVAEGLQTAAELAGADRCYLMSRLGDAGESQRYEWHSPEVEPFKGTPKDGSERDMRWALRQIRDHHILQIPDPAKLPDQAAPERMDLMKRGVRSMLGLTLSAGANVVGFIAFECVRHPKRWSEEELTRLRLLGEIFGNVLQRKRNDDEVERSRKGMLQAQKMEAVGRMAGGIAHDFNNLLTVILGNGHSLLNGLEEGDERAEEAEEITAAAERAAALTRQLLSFSRPQLGSVQPVDLNRIVKNVDRMLTRLIGEDVHMSVRVADAPAIVVADPAQLEQVIVNLVVNARSALEPGGSIHVSTEIREAEASRTTPLGPAILGEVVVLTVSDDGCGIDEATRSRIFEPFFTTREPGQGTGLGLAIVYGVVQRSGGLIDVRTARGEGTTFEIQLPRSQALGEDTAALPRTRTRLSGTVLVVEDEESVRRLTRRTLERAGVRVLVARDGMEGLEVAADFTGNIDLLLTDMVMPRMGGRELARRLLERIPGVPVLFMSGYPSERELSEGEAGPPPDLLQKPFTGPELIARVASLLAS